MNTTNSITVLDNIRRMAAWLGILDAIDFREITLLRGSEAVTDAAEADRIIAWARPGLEAMCATWIKDPRCVSDAMHGEGGRSYRSDSVPSLQIVFYDSGAATYCEIDTDEAPPERDVESLLHHGFGEVIAHAVDHSYTDPRKIAAMLDHAGVPMLCPPSPT